MNYTKTITHSFLLPMLLLASQQLSAGTIYRFMDENGIITMSKSLPPYASQTGYDILNDKSLRLIKHVAPALTPEQIVEKERQIAKQKEAERLAAEQAKKQLEQQQEQHRQQAVEDQILLANFQSEQELLDARDTDIDYRQTELDKAVTHLEESKIKLQNIQQEAAEQELSGKTISTNTSKRLAAVQQEINNDEHNIKQLVLEIDQLNIQYDHQLERLKLLLRKKKN